MNKIIEQYQDNKENKIIGNDSIFNAVYLYLTIKIVQNFILILNKIALKF